MKNILFFLIVLLFTLNASANPVDKKKAHLAASNFYSVKYKKKANVRLVYECTEKESKQKSGQTSFYYVFNAANDFVVIAGDDAVQPILAYSESGTFDPNKKMPEGCQDLLDSYKKQIKNVIQKKITATPKIEKQWKNLIKGKRIKAENSGKSLNVTAKWGQVPYVNQYCPYDNYYNERTVTGCPATAMAIIMKYWEHPAQGIGEHSYTHDIYGTLSANFGASSYNWGKMPDRVTNNADAKEIAKLMYHCGIGVEMSYGVSAAGGSGSYLIENGYPVDETCEHAYKTYFGYDANTMRGLYRDDFPEETWLKMLRTEIDEGRPLQYAGFGEGGHTFVFHGYDNQNRFQVNWGWEGMMDGYYSINNLAPGSGGTGAGGGAYNRWQQAIIGIQPETPAPFKLSMAGDVLLSSNQILKGQNVELTSRIKNTGSENFSGLITAHLLDEDGHYVSNFETVKGGVPSGLFTNLRLHFSASEDILPGNYRVVILYRQEKTERWKQAYNEGYFQNSADLKILGASDISLSSNIELSTENIEQNKAFDVSVSLKNHSSEHFYGKVLAALYDIQTKKYIQDIQQQTIFRIDAEGGTKDIIFSSAGINLAPGTYYLLIAYQKHGNLWEVAEGGDLFKNPVKINVPAPSLTADKYENNDSEESAYVLTPNFQDGKAEIVTEGSNIHLGTDEDFYTIELPSGNNYRMEAHVKDSYTDADLFTNDVQWAYKYKNNEWKYFNSSMDTPLEINDGGKLTFKVASEQAGGYGTYLLNINLKKIEKSGLAEIKNCSSTFRAYPNPAKEQLFITFNETLKESENLQVILYTPAGKTYPVKDFKSSANGISFDISDKTPGMYFVRLLAKGKELSFLKIIIAK